MQQVQPLKKEALEVVMAPSMQVQELPLSAIKSNPFQKRKAYGDIRTLADSISARGLMNPISVVKLGESYVIVSGHRRVLAYKDLRRKSIPAIVRRESTEKDLAIDIAIENLQRKDLTPIEVSETLQQMLFTIQTVQNSPSRAMTLLNQIKLCERRGEVGNNFTGELGFREEDLPVAEKILKLVGISVNTAIQYIRILQLPEEIQEKIVLANKGQTGSIPVGSLSVKMAYELTRVNGPGIQKELCTKVLLENLKYSDAKFLVDEIVENEPALANRNMGAGTAARRNDDDQGLRKLTEDCFELSSTVWNFRAKLPLAARRLDALLFAASLNKLKKACLEMTENINQLIKDDLIYEKQLELVNADLELCLKPGADVNEKLRFSFPKDKAEILKLNAGDKLLVKVEGIVRGAAPFSVEVN